MFNHTACQTPFVQNQPVGSGQTGADFFSDLLPLQIQIWAGGAGLAGIRKQPKGVRIIPDIGEAVAALKELPVQTRLDRHRE